MKNLKAMAGVWGSEKPAELSKNFEYLNRTGFVGPLKSSDPKHLAFDKVIAPGLFVRLVFNVIGEYPDGFVNYDTVIYFNSSILYDVDQEINIWGRDLNLIERAGHYETLWTIRLSHLKWNAVPGSNPKWQVKRPGDYTGDAIPDGDWVDDWRQHGERYIAAISSLKDAVRYLLEIEKYEPSSWVKSDGPASTGALENAAVLMVTIGDGAEAIRILQEEGKRIFEQWVNLPLPVHIKSRYERFLRILEWAKRAQLAKNA